MFDDILERKKGFLDSKMRKLKKSKNHDFSKGVSPWFGEKVGIFLMFLFLAKSASKLKKLKNRNCLSARS